MEINYKSATYENIDDIIELRLIYFNESDENFDKKTAEKLKVSMNNYLNTHLNKDCFVELAYDNGKVVSVLALNVIEKIPTQQYVNGKFGEIYGVYTRVEYRRHGIASTLMKRILEEIKDKELSLIKLNASELGRGIYKNFGFIYEDVEYKEMLKKLN